MKYERVVEILKIPNSEYLRASKQLSRTLEVFTLQQQPDWRRLQKTVLRKWGDHPEVKYLISELELWPVASDIDHDYLFVELNTGKLVNLEYKDKTPATQAQILAFAGNSDQLNAGYYQRMFHGPWGEACQAIITYRKEATLHTPPLKSVGPTLIETFLMGRLTKYGPLHQDQYAPQLARMAGKILYLMGYITNPQSLDESTIDRSVRILEANGVLCIEDYKLCLSQQ